MDKDKPRQPANRNWLGSCASHEH